MGGPFVGKILEAATPLGARVLLLRSMSGQEELGRLPEFQLEFISPRGDIKPAEILGKNISWMVRLESGEPRHFNGFVTGFAEAGEGSVAGFDEQLKHGFFYRATVHPWLWFLTRASNCRIFQNKDMLEIVEEVFKGYPFAAWEPVQLGSFPKREYSVQYRETDFNFVCRLMEQEGVYFAYDYGDGRNTLKLMNAYGAHKTLPQLKAPFYQEKVGAFDKDYVNTWAVSREIQPGKYTIDDFHYMRPHDRMTGQGVPVAAKDHDLAEFEIYDYPGEYDLPAEGPVYARTRIEELHAKYEQFTGSGNVRSVAPGRLLTLEEHPRSHYNAEYLITSVSYTASVGEFASGGSGGEFHCSIAAIAGATPFRPARITPKPIIQGPQTAIVVGKSGEEIHTDDEGLGRVKVQFHWDRYSKTDENSSCWVRVSQPIAGSSWGFLALPRIGHEVVVEFLEGDPDHPLITGSVYNNLLKPPYALPTEKTRTGFKSHSSKQGASSNFNELRFEDKKGEEDIYVHAEKDKTTRIKHDQLKLVKNEDHLIIEKDAFEKRVADHHISLKGNRNEKLESGTLSLEIAKGDLLGKVKTKLAYDVGSEIHLKSGGTIVLEADTKITLKVGSSHVTVETAKITLDATAIAIKGGGMIEIDAAMTKVNSGVSAGSAASGSGSSPTAPKDPKEAGDSTGGEEKAAPTKVAPEKYSPQAQMFAMAAESGTPTCEICNCPPGA